jgi:hypothetical protein
MVFFFFGSFAPHFQIKLSTHGWNLNSKFVSMNELELFLLTQVFTPNTMDLVQFLEKKSKTSHLDHSGHIEGDVMQNYEQKKKVKKKWKTKILWKKQTIFLAPCPSALG